MSVKAGVPLVDQGLEPGWVTQRGQDVRAWNRRVERMVWGPKHPFEQPSDVVVTNGLVRFRPGPAGGPAYLVVQAFADGAWREVGCVLLSHPSHDGQTLRTGRLERLTRDEAILALVIREVGTVRVVLRRGERMLRVRHGSQPGSVTADRAIAWLGMPPIESAFSHRIARNAGVFGSAMDANQTAVSLAWPSSIASDDWAMPLWWLPRNPAVADGHLQAYLLTAGFDDAFTTPDHADFTLGGVVSFRGLVRMGYWGRPGLWGPMFFMRQGFEGGTTHAWAFGESGGGRLLMYWTPDNVVYYQTYSELHGLVDGTYYNARVDIDTSNTGVQFFYKNYDTGADPRAQLLSNAGWTNIGTAFAPDPGPTSIVNTNLQVRVGDVSGESLAFLIIDDGVVRADPTFYAEESADAETIVDSTGKTWTRRGGAEIVATFQVDSMIAAITKDGGDVAGDVRYRQSDQTIRTRLGATELALPVDFEANDGIGIVLSLSPDLTLRMSVRAAGVTAHTSAAVAAPGEYELVILGGAGDPAGVGSQRAGYGPAGGPFDFARGGIDNVMFILGALSAAEAEAILAASTALGGLPHPESRLVMHLPFDVTAVPRGRPADQGWREDDEGLEEGLVKGLVSMSDDAEDLGSFGLAATTDVWDVAAILGAPATGDTVAAQRRQFAAESRQELRVR